MLSAELAEKLFFWGRPLSGIYGNIMLLRSFLYKKKVIRTRRLPVPVISVGNLSLGGTGKTPHVIEICEFLKKQGFRPVILTRGYGGRAGKGPLIVSDGKEIKAKVSEAGDEPWMIAAKLEGVPVIAGSDRYKCGLFALKRLPVSLFVLDDGFQHLGLEKDLDIVLMDATRPIGSERVFPGGTLREPAIALSRADVLILSKCNEVNPNKLVTVVEALRPYTKAAPIFQSLYEIDRIDVVFKGPISKAGFSKGNSLRGVFCFCGLARPQSFLELLKQAGAEVKGVLPFADHYEYKKADMVTIGKRARETGSTIVLTTEKDFAKISTYNWSGINRDLGLGVVRIRASLPPPFYRFISSHLENFSKPPSQTSCLQETS